MAFSESSGQPSDSNTDHPFSSTRIHGPDNSDTDWTDQVTDLVVDTVGKVRSRTTGPVLGIARGSVYGIVAAIVAIPVVIALFIGLVRLLNWAIPGPVWIVYAIFAAVFLVSGWFLWLKRDVAENPTPSAAPRR